MNHLEMSNPRHRLQAEKLAAALFHLMTEPTEWRVIVELNSKRENPRQLVTLDNHFYIIEGAMIDEENATNGNDFAPLPNGLVTVSGYFATDKPHRHDHHDTHPQAVAKWLLQVISRDRVRDVWAEPLQ